MKTLVMWLVILAVGGVFGYSAGTGKLDPVFSKISAWGKSLDDSPQPVLSPQSPTQTAEPVPPPATKSSLPPKLATYDPMAGPVNKLEMYVFAKPSQQVGGGQSLWTVHRWQGSESKEIRFTPPKSPWIINAGFKPTSNIASKFDIRVWKEVMPDVRISADDVGAGTIGGIYFYIIPDGTEHIIDIDASGGEWWVKVGVEQ